MQLWLDQWLRGQAENLRRMMRGRRKPLHLIVDGLPAHRTRLVRDYVTSFMMSVACPVYPNSGLFRTRSALRSWPIADIRSRFGRVTYLS